MEYRYTIDDNMGRRAISTDGRIEWIDGK